MLATVEEILSIYPHPDADAIEFARVLGYDCIVKKGEHRAGEKVVLIQPDTVIPSDREWATEVLKYLRRGRRVCATKLRGEWSMGLVMPLAILGVGEFDAGAEVSELLGVTKYEAPLPRDINARGGLPFGIPKTDEERWQNLGRHMERYIGSRVDVTLKVDGSSFTAYCVLPGHHPGDEPALGITSRTLDLKLIDGATNQWLEAARMTDVLYLLRGYCEEFGVSLAIRGEVYGTGIQSLAINRHSKLPRGVAFFSVWNIAEHRYERRGDPHYYETVCERLGLPTVPVLERDVPLTRDLIRKYDSELEQIDGEPFEGVVIQGPDFSFKVVNKSYDAKK